MNQYFKYALTVAVTVAAMVAYQYEGKPEQAGLAQQAPNQVPIQVTEIKNEIAQVEQAIPEE
jgi:predicted membrane-bound mannosyltransferase